MHALPSIKLTSVLAGVLLLSYGCSQSTETKNRTGQFVDRGVVEPGQNPGRPIQIEVDAAQDAQGTYAFELAPLGGSPVTNVSGAGSISVRGDHFEVSVKVDGLEAFSSHAQYLHEGAICPDLNADSNADEHLDSVEVLETSGKILIPFDGDLSAQMLDSNVFPAANGAGKISYLNAASFSLLIGDLRVEDENTEDSYTKLPLDQTLNFEGRTLVIYGVPTSTEVPATIRSFSGFDRQSSIPIACGKIHRVIEE